MDGSVGGLDRSAEIAKIHEARNRLDELLFKQGLYSSIVLDGEIGPLIEKMVLSGTVGLFDVFCNKCKKEMPFNIYKLNLPNKGGVIRGSQGLSADKLSEIYGLRAVCQRDLNVYYYSVMIVDGKLTKIGQYPSFADISFSELGGIDKSLTDIDRRELGQALGLFAHDAFIGAFAYLRRVFERMIERAYEGYVENIGRIEDFEKKKMDQKIALLKDQLPDNVVKNSSVFSVLSLGLHELLDEQCKKFFPLMKSVIFQMLEAEEHKRKALKAQQETQSQLQSLISSGSLREG